MIIDEITFRTIPEGLHAGLLTYQLHFTGLDIPEPDDELYDDILIVNHHKSPVVNVTFTGEFTNENSAVMLTVAKTLTDMGYFIRAISQGDMYHAWFTLVKHLVVKVDNSKWAMFNAGELHYRMSAVDDPIPYLPQNQKIPMYIDPDPMLPGPALLEYIEQANGVWSVLLKTKNNLVRVLK